jgi:hypothetical protein
MLHFEINLETWSGCDSAADFASTVEVVFLSKCRTLNSVLSSVLILSNKVDLNLFLYHQKKGDNNDESYRI